MNMPLFVPLVIILLQAEAESQLASWNLFINSIYYPDQTEIYMYTPYEDFFLQMCTTISYLLLQERFAGKLYSLFTHDIYLFKSNN